MVFEVIWMAVEVLGGHSILWADWILATRLYHEDSHLLSNSSVKDEAVIWFDESGNLDLGQTLLLEKGSLGDCVSVGKLWSCEIDAIVETIMGRGICT